MENHPYFNLKMHSDDQIQDILRSHLSSRQTIHEWPLSCVQLLTTASGKKVIYKSQYGPTVEAQFYAKAESPLMTKAEILYHDENYTIMLLEYIEGKLLEDQKYSLEEILHVGRLLVDEISKINGDLPCYRDLGTVDLWDEFVDQTLRAGMELIKGGTFKRITAEELSYLQEWSRSALVKAAFDEKIAITHGDTTGENIFIIESGYKIIDWQRPIKAPAVIDLAAWLESHGIASQEYINPAVTGIFYFIQLAWAVDCQVKWIPQASYEDWILGYLQKIMKTES